MAFLLRYLLLVMLMLGLAGQGSALARGGAAPPDAPSVHPHYAGAEPCDEGRCPEPEHADRCCVLNHCLLGLAAEQMGSLPQFAPARPVAAAAVRALAEAQDNPERPPRLI